MQSGAADSSSRLAAHGDAESRASALIVVPASR